MALDPVAADLARRALRARSVDEVHGLLRPIAAEMHQAAVAART